MFQNQEIKKAEIAAYFNKFDEAQNLYLDADRKYNFYFLIILSVNLYDFYFFLKRFSLPTQEKTW